VVTITSLAPPNNSLDARRDSSFLKLSFLFK